VALPAREELPAILDRTTGATDPVVHAVLGRERLLEMRDLVRQVPLARPLQAYAARPPVARRDKRVRYGSSPRGAQAVILAAKVRALADGRFAPSFEDVRRSAA